jgi:hypothetical protein
VDAYEIKAIYGDILRGFSVITYQKENIYLKHFSNFVLSDLDSNYTTLFKEAREKGLPTNEDRLKVLKEMNLWTESDEESIHNAKKTLEGLEATRRKVFLESQLSQITRSINNERINLTIILSRKLKLLGLTAESKTSSQISNLYLLNSTYKDKDFTIPLFSKEDWDNLSHDKFEEISVNYRQNSDRFSIENIRKVAISSTCQMQYDLCGDNPYNFFARPICYLTVHQTELCRWMKIFHSIITNTKNIPENLFNDPEGLVDWVQSSRNLQETANANKEKGADAQTTVIGATKKDREKAGLGNPFDFINDLREQGKTTANIQDIVNLQKDKK